MHPTFLEKVDFKDRLHFLFFTFFVFITKSIKFLLKSKISSLIKALIEVAHYAGRN